jgi:hypothetical protein
MLSWGCMRIPQCRLVGANRNDRALAGNGAGAFAGQQRQSAQRGLPLEGQGAMVAAWGVRGKDRGLGHRGR